MEHTAINPNKAAHIGHLRNAALGDTLVRALTFQGTPVEYTKFLSLLPEVDILITSSGAPHFILHKAEMQHVIGVRRNKPMFLMGPGAN